MTKHIRTLTALALTAIACVSLAVVNAQPDAPHKAIRLEMGKLEESDATSKVNDPNYGYEGHLGTFVATTKGEARAMIVVHNYPDTGKFALGNTKLTFEAVRKVGNVNGFVFKTEWDGKRYPSKVFLSSEKVYFGGGVNGYIAADYRDATGWAWKLIPLRRMDIVTGNGNVSAE